jgi:hypothetical protein
MNNGLKQILQFVLYLSLLTVALFSYVGRVAAAELLNEDQVLYCAEHEIWGRGVGSLEASRNCFSKQAILQKNISFCDLAPKGSFALDDCYIQFAKATKNPKICSKVSIVENHQSWCYRAVAGVVRDVRYCEDPFQSNDKNRKECLIEVFKNYANVEDCGLLNNQEYKDLCFDVQARNRAESRHCNEIKDSDLKTECIRLTALMGPVSSSNSIKSGSKIYFKRNEIFTHVFDYWLFIDNSDGIAEFMSTSGIRSNFPVSIYILFVYLVVPLLSVFIISFIKRALGYSCILKRILITAYISFFCCWDC